MKKKEEALEGIIQKIVVKWSSTMKRFCRQNLLIEFIREVELW